MIEITTEIKKQFSEILEQKKFIPYISPLFH